MEMFTEMAKNETDFMKFYGQFGKCLKLGILEVSPYRTKMAELRRFHSSKSGALQINLKKYVDSMK